MDYKGFIEFVDTLIQNSPTPITMPNRIREVYDYFKSFDETKVLLTNFGMELLRYMQDNNLKQVSAKEIAEGMGVSSRKVSGAIRKLNTDGFVYKFGSNPMIYSLTSTGKNFDIEQYKESLNHENEDAE